MAPRCERGSCARPREADEVVAREGERRAEQARRRRKGLRGHRATAAEAVAGSGELADEGGVASVAAGGCQCADGVIEIVFVVVEVDRKAHVAVAGRAD